MFEDIDNRGQVGIGTLIVFIAMVLVAAIAAGVLVNTAGFLQENAEQTGQEAQGEVSDRLDVVSAFAADNQNSDGDYETVTITVRKASGSDAISLDDTTYTYLGPNGDTASGTLNDSNSGITQTAVANNDASMLRNESDRVEVQLRLDTISDTNPLSPGEEFELQITTSSGASTYIEARIPETAETDGVVEV
jgi:flagellin-like protein